MVGHGIQTSQSMHAHRIHDIPSYVSKCKRITITILTWPYNEKVYTHTIPFYTFSRVFKYYSNVTKSPIINDLVTCTH